MLYEASWWDAGATSAPRPPFEEGLAVQEIAAYLDDYPASGEPGLIAMDDNQTVGAAWLRLWNGDVRGYGFVDARTPEVSIAVVPERRGEGIGEVLLSTLITSAREASFVRLSLSVSEANPARRLYERLGFLEVASEGASITMVLEL
jgi:GNAT superfamily N-acetyltransferase